MNKQKEKEGYTEELLQFTKEANPDLTEQEIINTFQEQRKSLAKKVGCELNCVQLSVNKIQKTINIDVKL